jgi:hypothetical protein
MVYKLDNFAAGVAVENLLQRLGWRQGIPFAAALPRVIEIYACVIVKALPLEALQCSIIVLEVLPRNQESCRMELIHNDLKIPDEHAQIFGQLIAKDLAIPQKVDPEDVIVIERAVRFVFNASQICRIVWKVAAASSASGELATPKPQKRFLCRGWNTSHARDLACDGEKNEFMKC